MQSKKLSYPVIWSIVSLSAKDNSLGMESTPTKTGFLITLKTIISVSMLAILPNIIYASVFVGPQYDGYRKLTGQPDPTCAVGPTQIVLVGNDVLEWYDKETGVQEGSLTFDTFFNRGGSFHYHDPSIIYDEAEGRFVLTTLHSGSPMLEMAATKDSNPIVDTDSWHKFEFPINADFPHVAVGEAAIYVSIAPFGSGQHKLYIFNKQEVYAGDPVTEKEHLPITESDAPQSIKDRFLDRFWLKAATTYGTLPPNVATFLVGFHNDSDDFIEEGDDDFLFVLRVEDPLGISGPTKFFFQDPPINVGDVARHTAPYPEPKQKGGADLRIIAEAGLVTAVWQNDRLWTATHVWPKVSSGRDLLTVHWFGVDTSNLNSLLLAEDGQILADDIVTEPDGPVSTFFPSVTVDELDNVGISFSVTSENMYPSAFFAIKLADGGLTPVETLALGTDPYALGVNIWGDYSGCARDPSDRGRMWAMNMYSKRDGDFHWASKWGSFSVRKTLLVPESHSQIQDAIDAASFSYIVSVDENLGVPYAEQITMKSGVQVSRRNATQLPIIDAGNAVTTAVIFPSGANPITALDGFEVRGGTSEVVSLLGQGVLSNSIVSGDGANVGVRVQSSSANLTIDGCSVINVTDGLDVLTGGTATLNSSTTVNATDDGVVCRSNGTVNINGGDIFGATTGGKVSYGGTANISQGANISADPALSSAGVFAFGSDTAVNINDAVIGPAETGVWAQTGSLSMSAGTVKDCDWGVWVEGDAVLTLGSGTPSYGSQPDVTIQNCEITGIGVDTPQPSSISAVLVDGTAVTTSNWAGIHFLPGSDVDLTRCVVQGSTAPAQPFGATGILVESSANLFGPKVFDISPDNFGTGIAIDVDSTTSVKITEPPLSADPDDWNNFQSTDSYFGIDVRAFSRPTIQNGLISDHYSHCVLIGPAAVPNLGTKTGGPSRYGNNSIHGITATQGLLAGGMTRLGGFPDVSAEKNWWGSPTPPANKISSWVDYTPYLTGDPYPPLGVWLEMVPVPEEIRRSYPVPFRSRVTIPFSVESASEPIEISVYDISGRRIKTVLKGFREVGEHEISWDGKFDDGRLAASGIYYIRVKVGVKDRTDKLVLTR